MPFRDRTMHKYLLLLITLGPIMLYWVTSYFWGGRVAIELGNAALFCMAGGVAVTFIPKAREAVFGPLQVQFQNVLGLGIFLGWSAVFFARLFSMIWRALGQDPSWLDSAAWGMHIAMSMSAALCHYLAPKTLHGAIPAPGWVNLGALVAGGLIIFSLLVWAL